MDVLCTDKTGTLTEAKIAHVGSVGVDGKDSARVTDLIRFNSRFASGMGSNLDNAILTGMPVAADGWTHVDNLPFDFERRRASVLVARGGERELITKGAPEALLSLCTQMEAADGTVAALGEAERTTLVSLMEEKGRQGLRLLGVARRRMAADCRHIELSDEAESTTPSFSTRPRRRRRRRRSGSSRPVCASRSSRAMPRRSCSTLLKRLASRPAA